MRSLYRSRHERVIAGVCGGIADYFKIDVTVVRLIWAVAVFAGGTGILAYILAALIIPEEPYGYVPDNNPSGRAAENGGATEAGAPAPGHAEGRRTQASGSTAAVFGWFLLGFGLLLLLRNFIPWFTWGLFWPLVLIAFGAYIVFTGLRGDHR
ncbi:MAG: PspC domain-containing protein [Bacillota bacterium]